MLLAFFSLCCLLGIISWRRSHDHKPHRTLALHHERWERHLPGASRPSDRRGAFLRDEAGERHGAAGSGADASRGPVFPVESVFELAVTGAGVSAVACRQAIPPSQITFTTTPAGPRCNAKAAPSARPAEPGATKDKSLVSPTAKAVAPPVAQASRKKK